jgi:hypothetical protein
VKWKTLWNDPVWSTVIATAIVAVAGVLIQQFRHAQWFWWSALSAALIGGCVWLYRARRTVTSPLAVDMDVSTDPQFSHVAIVNITLRNNTRKPVRVNSVEFETKQHWDLPDDRREGITRPVFEFLPRDAAFIKIAIEKGSIASKAIGTVVKAGGSATSSFRLVTDHAVPFGFGLFPFHLSVSLKYGTRGDRVRLPDLVVSLHGSVALSSRTMSDPSPLTNPGEIQHLANAVLTVVNDGAQCPSDMLVELRKVARVEGYAPPRILWTFRGKDDRIYEGIMMARPGGIQVDIRIDDKPAHSRVLSSTEEAHEWARSQRERLEQT